MKIGVLADNLVAPYQVYELVSWIHKQKNIDAQLLVIQNVPKGSKLMRIRNRSFNENLSIITFKLLTLFDSFLVFDNLKTYNKCSDIKNFFKNIL